MYLNIFLGITDFMGQQYCIKMINLWISFRFGRLIKKIIT